MTKVMLIAGVATLAIATPAAAGPHGDHGGGNPHGGGQAYAQQDRGGGRNEARGGGFAAPRMQAQRVDFQQRARTDFSMQRNEQRQARAMQMQRGQERQVRAFQMQRNEQRQARAMQMQRGEQRQARAFQMQRNEQRQARAFQMQRNEQRQARAMQMQRNDQRQARMFQQDRRQQQARMFQQRNDQRQARLMQEQQIRDSRMQQRQAIADNRISRMQQMQQMQQFRAQRQDERAQVAAREFARNDFAARYANVRNNGFIDGCPPGLAAKNNGCLPPGQAMKLLGTPVSQAASLAALTEVPRSLQYLYPETPNYYYRYGNGYMYQVDRSSNLINSLLPLVGGGYLPGMTFPSSYMNSYAPDYYGFNSFYPDTEYANYRYMDGNMYGIDPYSGAIQDVIPTYAYGYGVGQMLPAGYGYYNVPTDYRSLYYDTPDANYWYAPGAIYQVDPSTQLITSVASLLSPGLSVGQTLPMGYDTYNVPMAYRSTYYDTPNAWYRYNNGNIYQVDPTTQLVTAIVASLLT